MHKHYSIPRHLVETIDYAIMVINTLRPLEGSAHSMRWRRVGIVRGFTFFLAVWEVELSFTLNSKHYKSKMGPWSQLASSPLCIFSRLCILHTVEDKDSDLFKD